MHALDSVWEALKRDFDSALARRMRDLNHVFQRLRSYEDEEQWLRALTDGIAICAKQFGILTLEGGTVRLRAAQNISSSPGPTDFPLDSARAFAAVAESREPLTVLCSPSEVGPLAKDAEEGRRAGLYPVANAGRVVAFVFAETNDPLDTDVIELVTGMASAVLERQANTKKQLQIASLPLPSLAPERPESTARQASLPPWAALDGETRSLHSRAQRFARRAVAEIELARPEACRAGREQSNLYLLLQGEIDKARDTYLKQFMKAPSMVDYLHLELIRAAGGEERQLGADYPGHLQ